MKTKTEKWDVVVYELETRKIEAVVGTDLREDGFHSVARRIDTMSPRVGDDYDVMGVPAGQFKEGDVLPEDVEEYVEL